MVSSPEARASTPQITVINSYFKRATLFLVIAGSATPLSVIANGGARQPSTSNGSSKLVPISVNCYAHILKGEGFGRCEIPVREIQKIWDKKPKESCQADGPKPRQPNDGPLPRGMCKNWQGQTFECPKPKAPTANHVGQAKGKKPSGAPKVQRVFPAIP